MSPPPSSPLRSVVIGLCGGLLLSGLLLFGLALRTRLSQFDCGAYSVEECLMAQAIASDWSRLQLLVGTALTLLGLGGLLWQRSALARQGPTP
ncbi:MAG: hypothetical protein M3Y59_02315 [Myxococcota bacterium]|nr:hypothetical protein [Myxococcota bacterium]